MPLISGFNRQQMTMICLDQEIASDAEVRLIDVFVEVLEVDKMQFKHKGESKEGRPAYASVLLLKLFVYGYLNRVRSSRQLEKQCKINVELQWLLCGLRPCHQTINTFRKDNARGLLKIFRQFNKRRKAGSGNLTTRC